MSAVTLFIPHGGGPLPLLDDPGHLGMNRFLRTYPESIKRPEAIVVVSAHWEAEVVSITASPRPELIFDYYGFPPETYEYRYPAPGLPALAERMHAMLADAGVEACLDHERGFDHGMFVPLMLMYPEADIPVVQLSLTSDLDPAAHVAIGRALGGLKDEPLLFLGSGFSFHNLREIMGKRDAAADARNQAFEAWLADTMSDGDLPENEREARLLDWAAAPHARYCHPREEHLLPLHTCYGFAGRAAKTVFQEPVVGFVASAYEWRE